MGSEQKDGQFGSLNLVGAPIMFEALGKGVKEFHDLVTRGLFIPPIFEPRLHLGRKSRIEAMGETSPLHSFATQFPMDSKNLIQACKDSLGKLITTPCTFLDNIVLGGLDEILTEILMSKKRTIGKSTVDFPRCVQTQLLL